MGYIPISYKDLPLPNKEQFERDPTFYQKKLEDYKLRGGYMIRIWHAIIWKSYSSYNHPKNLEEMIKTIRLSIQDFFRIFGIRFQRLWNHDWVKCPYQDTSPIFVSSSQKWRWWREPNGDRTCEYCGSWHPDEFINFVNQIIATGGECGSVELNDSRAKIYITRPKIHNGAEGAVKFKLNHLAPEDFKKFQSNINEALKISHAKFTAKMKPGTKLDE